MHEGQRRATAGGEYGANGEWYEGGKFIATKDRPKSAPPERVESRPDPLAYAKAEWRKQLDTWVISRRIQNARILGRLLACPFGMDESWWMLMAENRALPLPSLLAQDLSEVGTVTERQAEIICKAYFRSRQNKQNRDAWESMKESISETFDVPYPS